jgi:shikimate kinase
MPSKLIRTPGLYLVGFMGCGKTTIGRLLADDMGWEFADLDDDIEAAARVTIVEIFEHCGEEVFRRMEHDALDRRVRAIQRGDATVLSLGGGAFAQPRNFELIEENGISIWLDCPLDRIRDRIAGQNHRPLARDPEKFEALYCSRRESYSRADFRIEITGDDPNEAVAKINELPLF